jgi:F420-0:gamma-glutamyl ligase
MSDVIGKYISGLEETVRWLGDRTNSRATAFDLKRRYREDVSQIATMLKEANEILKCRGINCLGTLGGTCEECQWREKWEKVLKGEK